MARDLVVHFSRSGNTDTIAREIASALGADLERITEPRERGGLAGYLRSGSEAARRKLVPIDEPKNDLSSYDLVVIGTPVWVGTLSSPVRSFLVAHRKNLKDVAFFCTMGGRGYENTFREMESASGKAPADVLWLRESELKSNAYVRKVARFVRELRLVLEPEPEPKRNGRSQSVRAQDSNSKNDIFPTR